MLERPGAIAQAMEQDAEPAEGGMAARVVPQRALEGSLSRRRLPPVKQSDRLRARGGRGWRTRASTVPAPPTGHQSGQNRHRALAPLIDAFLYAAPGRQSRSEAAASPMTSSQVPSAR